jgi:flagellar hook-associated protein 2
VAELLAGDKIVRSNSPNFSYVGMLMKDMVKAGTHSVKIENVGGEVQVWIGGVQAEYDKTTNEWTSKAEGSRGLVIRVDIPPANPGDSYESTLTVKQGKINELNELFKSELKGANQQIGAHTDEKGSLHILRENYLDIIKNIDKKIAQEETRLIQWETRMRMQFSRLDTLLSNYENLMTSNAAALASASANYSNNK